MEKWIPARPNVSADGPLKQRIESALTIPETSVPGIVTNMKEVAGILQATDRTTPVRIFGDYDADGITSSWIMKKILKKMGYREVATRLPRRFSEGYGFSEKALSVIPAGVNTLVITVDNGIAAHDVIAKAKAMGATVLVIDHHIGDASDLPPADVVCDPNAVPGSTFSDYCAAGLCYRLAETLGVADNDMLCFAAVGTVADVMPLIGDNRRIVQGGLDVFRKGQAPAVFNELYRKCTSKPMSGIVEKDIAFTIGPCLNAWGRIADDGAQRTLSVAESNGSDAWRMKAANDERKKLKTEIGAVALKKIRDGKMWGDKPLIITITKDEVETDAPLDGMIGIVAGEQANSLQTPCFVFTPDNDGNWKGSGRSFGGINMKHCLDKVSDLLNAYGGHAGAAGLTVRSGCLEEFKRRISEVMAPMDIETSAHTYDVIISADEVPEAIDLIAPYAPFGEGNPYPVFKITGVKPAGTARSYESGFFRLDCDGVSVTGMGLTPVYNKYPGTKEFTVYGTICRDYDFRSGAEVNPRIEAEDLEDANGTPAGNMLEELLATL